MHTYMPVGNPLGYLRMTQTPHRAKARMVAMGYSQAEGVDYFENFAPTASAISNRLVAAMACKLDWDLRHLDVDQAFIQSELDTDLLLIVLVQNTTVMSVSDY